MKCKEIGGAMRSKFLRIIEKASVVLKVVAGLTITFAMFITIVDIILRTAGHSIMGTYEIVGFSGALIVGSAIPVASWSRNHVFMEFVLDKFPKTGRNVLNTITRVACIILFLLIAINLFRVASRFIASGLVSTTLQLPIYPFAYALGICCLIECLVFVCDIIKIWEGKYGGEI